MCGRVTQYRAFVEYLEELDLQGDLFEGIDPAPVARYNVAPRSMVQVLHRTEAGLCSEPVRWGYKPFWSNLKEPEINARSERLMTAKYWRPLMKRGRGLLMIDGWYEWKKAPSDKKIKQPYLIRPKSGRPMLVPILGEFPKAPGQSGEHDGFALVTAASDSGMVDIHDRRPLALPASAAREWLNPDVEPASAEALVLLQSFPADAFTWHPVSRDVGSPRNQGHHLIEEVSNPII